ncbi:trimethylamine methyltransferase family protein [Halodesulfurarchaeum sp.]|uniref:trimethylamine methyltransferase family protein n=1 Tax=Halodesulfurarchaeum sp. TaxID=1980530 RepID=UPI002FC35D22
MRTGIKGGQLKLLTDEQVTAIHNAALQILSETGLKIENEEAMDLLEEAGADVDREDDIAKIPPHVVNECIERAPRSIRLSARDPDQDVLMEPERSFLSSCNGPPYVYDYEAKDDRKPTREDVRDSVKLQNELPNIDMSWAMFTLQDEPMLGFVSLYELLANNTKHNCILSHYGGEMTKKLVEMVELVAEAEDVSNKNLVTMYNEPVSPLYLRRETTESLLEWTRAGLPLISSPMPDMGATGPMTFAGTTALGLAESLGGIVIGELNNPGTPMLMGSLPVPMDMRIGSHAYYLPERIFYQSFTGQWARKYGVPVFGTGGISDSFGSDFQLGSETTISLWNSILTGQNLIHDLGVIGSGFRNSLEVVAAMDEVGGMVKRVCEGFDVNAETLALDVIDEVGHGGTFLSEPHTRKFGKSELFMADLLKKREQENWHPDVGMDAAHERVKTLLDQAEPKPLPEDVDDRLQKIIEDARHEGKELATL